MTDGAPRPELRVWVRALPSDPVAATAALAGRTGADEAAAWSYVPNFVNSTKKSRHFIVRPDPEGAATLTFGDAEKGRRLPTGTSNVIARYRTGGGPDGNVTADALTLFQSTVLGGERVRNPVPAVGGVDAERVADVRRNVSRGLVALGRIVACSDLEDYVGAWPGVAKVDVARARGANASFLVTYATRGDDVVDVDELKRELARNGAAGWNIEIVPCRRRRFTVAARLLLRADAIASDVVAAATSALTGAFAFENRAFREDVKASAVMALLQRVRGVRAVVLEALYETRTNRAVHDLAADAGVVGEAASVLFLEARDVALTPVPAANGEADE
jgi:predicted phage baseplate assembly protein